MEVYGLTDLGLVRKQNQDDFRILQLGEKSLLAVVCDGMGGAKSGNVASKLASDVFSSEVERSFTPELTLEKAEAVLREACSLANQAVYEHSQLSEDFAGMGTTLVAILIKDDFAVAANVGDSRVYRINEDGISCVSKDHSLVEMMVQRGEISKEQARTHPQKNLITRAVGTERAVECDIFRLELSKDEQFLLCSDGLSNLLADQEILFEVLHGTKKSDCCKRLLQIAKDRGAPDNVTSVLVCL
ncbi:MAG: Stp1/IreP family PP2C-type Ser/Thr phosphatase [Clostridia bacterium]|nr:Stp1/IreP family PP2C-type Ser/Thr phosphatase [Clostridia bacterium]